MKIRLPRCTSCWHRVPLQENSPYDKFSHAPVPGDQQKLRLARHIGVIKKVQVSTGNVSNTRNASRGRLSGPSGLLWLQGYPEAAKFRQSSPGLSHSLWAAPVKAAQNRNAYPHSSHRNGMSLFDKKESKKDPHARESIEAYTEAIQSDLRKIQTRNWWSWSNTVVILLLLTGTIVSFTLPSLLRADQPFSALNMNLAIRGLIGLVLLFNVYSLWQQLRIKGLCDEIQKKQASSETLYRMAMFDPLTGLYNRRFVEPRIEAELVRCQRKGTPLTLVLLDLDRFKEINDNHGHSAGDTVLRAFAERISKAIRGSDLAARLGGDEFMLLLPECDSNQLQRVLERLMRFKVNIAGEKISIEFSAGWKEHTPGESSTDLLEAADRALYQNKRGTYPKAEPLIA
jgi:diguanylate cyclase (GGDEF)-like protein